MASQHQIVRATAELTSLLAAGQRIYTTATQLVALRSLVRTWVHELGVEIVFDPSTPADMRDYLLGGSLGALEGAFEGALVGLVLGSLFQAPGSGMALGAGLGALAGAASGVQRVSSGHRVRIRAWRTSHGPVALVEAD